METKDFDSADPVAWCGGCGNFGMQAALKTALARLGKQPHELLLVSGIGQAAKMPHYIKANFFNGLHGRALPAAAAAKIANRALTVIVTTGDGDCYGEGGNHFLHNIRRNVDMTVIVHDNQIYGLTKGQASPTSEPGMKTKIQPGGVILAPFPPLETALALGCGFVARGYAAEKEHLAELILAGIKHKGFSLIDVFQPCASFNKLNTFDWYAARVYKVGPEHDTADKGAAMALAAQRERLPIGVMYSSKKPSYEELSGLDGRAPLVEADLGKIDISGALADFR
ncbi:MAG TPA: 2-oxoacid ferredoxin oxidoreductase [Elusimicrobia bacterium]|nr:MAG: 2-oxoacid ferredoxin oxidoreductase [Elusimicrobia bacterium GWF2_62_30]HBA61208.1 2-oxoacid ferredoxin oxidoreductase [Elusimicrobiota bacterium]